MGLGLLLLVTGCAYLERPYTYHEFDGLFVYYKTQDVARYRELLPSVFEMPAEPMVMVFVMDYYKMNKTTEPYKEAAVFLLVEYQKQPGWHCVTMPVTTDDARIKGIKYLGYPKIMGDVRLERAAPSYKGTLLLSGKPVMTIHFDSKKDVSRPEEEWFEKFSSLPNFNLLDGKVYEPKFGQKANVLTVSRAYPDILTVATGTSTFTQDAEAARAGSEQLAKIMSIKPSEIVLTYYLKNTFTQSFGMGRFVKR